MKNAKKLNNKGFSLVELIIVIAIMAVLIGVLSPAYLRYVEKSRKSADVQGIDAVMSAMETAAVDSSLNLADGEKMTITINKEKTTIASECLNDDTAKESIVNQDLTDTLGTSYVLKSGDWLSIVITGEVESGRVKFTCNPTYKNPNDKSQLLSTFAPDMAKKLNLSEKTN